MSRARFLPDFGAMPTHDTPHWTPLTQRHIEITDAIAKQLILSTARAMGVGEEQSVDLRINGRNCRLLGDSLDDWYLAETVSLEPADKVFYLLPLHYQGLERHGGKIPTVRFEDTDFDNRHELPREVRMIHLYVINLLADMIHG